MDRQPCVYILASGKHGTLYIGVTSNLLGRLQQHREGLIKGFTSRYDVVRLVHYEMADTMDAAIARECRTVLGAAGITLEYPLMRHANNLESVLTYEGTSEVHQLVIGQALTGESAFR